jgi:hypothetical protein
MMRTNFIGTVLVIVLGVNLGAWTLSVATNPAVPFASVSVPVGAPAMDARSQAASAEVSITPAPVDQAAIMTGTSTTATSSAQ